MVSSNRGIMMETETGVFEYIGGAAGCGKTWLARERTRANPFQTRLCASTGIAAINLGQTEFTCTTINSLLWYFDTKSLEDAYTTGKLDRALYRLLRAGTRQIILDEVSMMSGKQIDIICKGLDAVNQGQDSPIGLTLIGDFCQLPPIEKRGMPREGFAFEAKHWDRFAENTTMLTEIKRQTDIDFVQALRAVRRGDGKAAVEFFEPFMDTRIDVDFEGTSIMAKNVEVDRFNELRLDRLNTEWVRFPSYRFDKQLSEWKKLPQILDIKLDALVMILVNKSNKMERDDGTTYSELEYCNGDLGYLRDVTADNATVELVREGRIVTVPYNTKENVVGMPDAPKALIAEGRANLEAFMEGDRGKLRPPYLVKDPITRQDAGIVIGTCEHMPLRVAYATTCHKSQGLTLDRVQINLNNQFFSQGGMAYVGLSRARTAEGLRIICGNPNTFINRCKTNPLVEQWL